MTFDGLSRCNPSALITPYHYHPRTSATYVALGRTLAGAYTHAQTHGRFLFAQQWSWNGRNPAEVQSSAYFEAATPQLLFQATVRIPDQVTRLACMMTFRVGAGSSTPAWNPRSTHYIMASDGVHIDTGDQVDVAHPQIPWSVSTPRFGINPSMPFDQCYRVGCMVDLVNVLDANGNVTGTNPYVVSVYGHAENDGGGSSCAYQPVALVGWWESN